MNNLSVLWHWLVSLTQQPSVIDILTLVGIVCWTLIILGALVRLFYAFVIRPKTLKAIQAPPKSQTPEGDSLSPAAELRITFDHIQALLKSRDVELQRDMERMVGDVNTHAVLARERQLIEAARQNLRKAYSDFKDKINLVYRDLEHFRGLFAPHFLHQARQALEAGEASPAEALLKLALEKDTEKQAEAFHLLGVLAESRIDYIAAAHHYADAAAAQPDNLAYVTVAAQFAYFVQDYAASERHLRNALQLQEKILGSEHPDVALTLNNLAATCVSRQRYEEAAAFYEWALEIYEKTLGLAHPRVQAAVGDYATLLREMGLESEAKALEDRLPAATPPENQ